MTYRELFERANAYQRERLLDLVGALRELRREIQEDHDLLDPRLAAPRSSLNPRRLEGEE
jgi:hypothetical protein